MLENQIEEFIIMIKGDKNLKSKFFRDPGICREYGISPAAIPMIMAKLNEDEKITN